MFPKLDIVLFGATGFTGKHAIPYIKKFSKTKTGQLTWGVAGRSEQKMRTILNDYKQTDVPIIIADVQNEESIKAMVGRARIVINCCGPFSFYGEQVVKACVEEGTHYVDVSGELQFVEKMQLKYCKKAEEKGVYIISTCGLESIPVDLGIVFLQQNFTGTLNSIEAYLEFWETEHASGTIINYTTWESAAEVLWNKEELRKIRQQLYPDRLPIFYPRLKLKVFPHKSSVVKNWAVPFHGADLPVAKRSQRLFYERDSKRPIQVETYFTFKSFLFAILAYIIILSSLIVTRFTFAKKLFLEYPKIFSFGLISRESPDEERMKKSEFRITLYGEGWKKSLSNANDQYTTPPNRAITAEVRGREPGYGATNIMLVLAAITVITETDRMPPTGGVYPPGYAFANTSLVEQLTTNGINFNILYEEDL